MIFLLARICYLRQKQFLNFLLCPLLARPQEAYCNGIEGVCKYIPCATGETKRPNGVDVCDNSAECCGNSILFDPTYSLVTCSEISNNCLID